MISLLYPSPKVKSGYVNYSLRLIKGLREIFGSIEEIPIRKLEVGFIGKPILGNTSQSFFAKFSFVHGNIVHSLTPNVINSKTNVVTVHDIIAFKNPQKYATSFYRKLGYNNLIKSIKNVGNYIVFTEQAKSELSTLLEIENDRIYVVTQSIDHSVFFRELSKNIKPTDKKLIITVGDLNPRKRYDILFHALGGLEDFEVVHIGPVNGWYERKRELERIVSSYNNINMIGEVNDAILRQYMSSADLLVQLSEGEGFGLTPIEAIACGTNVLVSDLPIFHETLDRYATYSNFSPKEVREKVEEALKLLHTPEELINYSKKFAIERMARSTLEVYRKISTDF